MAFRAVPAATTRLMPTGKEDVGWVGSRLETEDIRWRGRLPALKEEDEEKEEEEEEEDEDEEREEEKDGHGGRDRRVKIKAIKKRPLRSRVKGKLARTMSCTWGKVGASTSRSSCSWTSVGSAPAAVETDGGHDDSDHPEGGKGKRGKRGKKPLEKLADKVNSVWAKAKGVTLGRKRLGIIGRKTVKNGEVRLHFVLEPRRNLLVASRLPVELVAFVECDDVEDGLGHGNADGLCVDVSRYGDLNGVLLEVPADVKIGFEWLWEDDGDGDGDEHEDSNEGGGKAKVKGWWIHDLGSAWDAGRLGENLMDDRSLFCVRREEKAAQNGV